MPASGQTQSVQLFLILLTGEGQTRGGKLLKGPFSRLVVLGRDGAIFSNQIGYSKDVRELFSEK